jgi:hypothetical protein
MPRIATGIAVALAAFFLLLVGVQAEKLTPETFTCEKAFGPGYTPHPEYKYSCCWPGRVPIPGKPGCVFPEQLDAAIAGKPLPKVDKPAKPTVNNQPSSNIRDAEGRPGAPGGHCIPTGLSCTIGGAPCCSATASCQGKFPNTMCQ